MSLAKACPRVWPWLLWTLYAVTWAPGAFATSPSDGGPGGPILLIGSHANPFGSYIAEILRAEGLNEFTAIDISLLTPAMLDAHDVVIVGEMPLSAAQVTMLTSWVGSGGTLIAMRPDKQLAGLLGLADVGGTLANKYLLVNVASGPGLGIVDQTMQYHGTADLYALSGATPVATLYSSATTSTIYPAVTMYDGGSNGGRAIAFTYDLPRSVVYTRQGNPAWAGQLRDGRSRPRSDDLFFGAARWDPQPDWVDLNKVAIPQADEQQRLLANLIIQSESHRMPLPRFWYLPRGTKAVVIMTGDDHQLGVGTQPRFEEYLAESDPGCSIDDWGCIRASSYLFVGPYFTNVQAALYDSLGFEVALHPNHGCTIWNPATLDSAIFTPELQSFANSYPSVGSPVSERMHCVVWSDWATQAEVEVAHGIRFDANYYYFPPEWVQDRPGLFTGSGMPMRFARLDGSVIDCYQAVTQMTDESGQTYPMTIDSLLSRALGPLGYYGVFNANMHMDTYPHPGSDTIVALAKARGVPVVSSRQMLQWLDGRNGSSFGALTWSGGRLSFTVATAFGSRGIEAMLPTLSAAGALSAIARDGLPVAFQVETIKGIAYAFFPATAGSYVALYGGLTDVSGHRSNVPLFTLADVTPNPSSGLTRVEFAVGEKTHVRLSVSDLQGRDVAVLAEGVYAAGTHRVWWDGAGPRGQAPPGMYFVRYEAAGLQLAKRVLIIR